MCTPLKHKIAQVFFDYGKHMNGSNPLFWTPADWASRLAGDHTRTNTACTCSWITELPTVRSDSPAYTYLASYYGNLADNPCSGWWLQMGVAEFYVNYPTEGYSYSAALSVSVCMSYTRIAGVHEDTHSIGCNVVNR